MVDFVGQNIEIGDFVVIRTPYYNTMSLGRVTKLNNATCTAAYIPSWLWELELSYDDYKQVVDALFSDNFADYSGKEEIKITSGRFVTSDKPWEFSFWSTSRKSSEFVRVDRSVLSNFFDSKLN